MWVQKHIKNEPTKPSRVGAGDLADNVPDLWYMRFDEFTDDSRPSSYGADHLNRSKRDEKDGIGDGGQSRI